MHLCADYKCFVMLAFFTEYPHSSLFKPALVIYTLYLERVYDDIVIAVAKNIKPIISKLHVIPVHFQVSGVLDPTMTATAKIAIAINTNMLPTCIPNQISIIQIS